MPFLPYVWLLDVKRAPLHFRYRLVGAAEVRVLGTDPTGRWLDEIHSGTRDDPAVQDRLHYNRRDRPSDVGAQPRAVGARAQPSADRECLLPLAADSKTVDMILACSVLCRSDGTTLRV